MSSSSEDEESSEESSCPSEWSDDDERSYDQEDSDIDKDTEKRSSSRIEPTKVTSLRGKRKRKGRREDETSSDQEESDQDEEAEKDWHDRRGEPKVASRGRKQERRRKRKREPEDRISSDQEETDQEEENRTSQNKLEKHRQDEGASQRDERVRKKLRGDQSSETVAGIIYLSRVPPFMKPHKVKHLLSRYGSVGRVYLKPEDPIVRQRRVKYKGNKKKNFTEGWVEFLDKRVAKGVALMLNNTPIGGKKRSYYHDDLWNIKYLSKFRWTHLTEKIAYEQAVREQRMRTEISQAKRENSHYLASVEKGKEIKAIVERKRKRGATEDEVTKLQRKYKQRRVTEQTAQSRETDFTMARKSQSRLSIDTTTSKIHLSDSLLKKILPG